MIIGTGCRVQDFSLIPDSSVVFLAGIQSAGDLVSENIASLCQSIEINYNKHVYRQRWVQKATGSSVKWAECSLIMGIGCWIQVLAWSSIA